MVLDLEEAIIQAALSDLVNYSGLDCRVRRVELCYIIIQSAIVVEGVFMAYWGMHTREVNEGDFIGHFGTIEGIKVLKIIITLNF